VKTRAVVFTGRGEVDFAEVEVPPPGFGEVQVRTLKSMISSGTEGWILQNRFSWTPTSYPAIPGYQRVGVVEAVGEGVAGIAVGQRVLATRSIWAAPMMAHSGAHAGLGNTPADEIYMIPDGVADIEASGTVVAQVGYNAAQRLVAEAGARVLVYGDGVIGQCAAQAARARGFWVAMAGHRTERLALAGRHSADLTLNTRDGDLGQRLAAHLGGHRLAAVLDTVQGVDAQRDFAGLLERGQGGQIVYCGFTDAEAWADMGDLQRREITAHFVSGWTRKRIETTLQLIAAGKMRLEPLITHHVSASDAPAMYRMIAERRAPFLGIALDWTTIG
jgi:2-desacetyl-2-hydroxyethyl bacteriochlorophyllide A dehydrogenase